MLVNRVFLAGGVLATGLLIGSASANEASSLKEDEWNLIRRTFKAGDTLDSVKPKALAQFRRADIDGGGISDSDYTLAQHIALASRRAEFVSRWLRGDLDGDGEVTRAELEALFSRAANQLKSDGVELVPTKEQIEQKLDKLVGDALEADRNKDDRVTFSEALATVHDTQTKRRGNRNRTVPLTFDRDGNGVVTEGEFVQILDRSFARIDGNGDGVISQTELSSFVKKTNEAVQAAKMKARKAQMAAEADGRAREQAEAQAEKDRAFAAFCSLPKAPDDAKILLVGTRQGKALSTVGLGGDDVAVSVANVWIEPGAEPLYVLLASHSATIWQFSGAVERVATVVAGSQQIDANGKPRAGIVGLPAGRIHAPRRSDCLEPFSRANSSRANKTTNMVPYLVGRAADLVTGSAGISTVSLPTGLLDRATAYANVVELPEGGPSADLWREVLLRYPGGLVKVDAAAIVSPSSAARHAVLPKWAGLAQLVEDGALKILETIKVVTVDGDRIFLDGGNDTIHISNGVRIDVTLLPRKLLITKKIRFPGDLDGSLEFVLGPGVPDPDGSPGGSTVTR